MITDKNSHVQSLCFLKSKFSVKDAKDWLKKNNYIIGNLEETKKSYKFEQRRRDYKQFKYEIKPTKEGVSIITGTLINKSLILEMSSSFAEIISCSDVIKASKHDTTLADQLSSLVEEPGMLLWLHANFCNFNVNKKNYLLDPDEFNFAKSGFLYKPININHMPPPVGVLAAGAKVLDEDRYSRLGYDSGFIEVYACIWEHLYPEFAMIVKEDFRKGELNVSLETRSEKYLCMGCNKEFPRAVPTCMCKSPVKPLDIQIVGMGVIPTYTTWVEPANPDSKVYSLFYKDEDLNKGSNHKVEEDEKSMDAKETKQIIENELATRKFLEDHESLQSKYTEAIEAKEEAEKNVGELNTKVSELETKVEDVTKADAKDGWISPNDLKDKYIAKDGLDDIVSKKIDEYKAHQEVVGSRIKKLEESNVKFGEDVNVRNMVDTMSDEDFDSFLALQKSRIVASTNENATTLVAGMPVNAESRMDVDTDSRKAKSLNNVLDKILQD